MFSQDELPTKHRVLPGSPSRKGSRSQSTSRSSMANVTYFEPQRSRQEVDSNGETLLIRAFRTGQKKQFMDIYGRLSIPSQVNQFMFNVFIFGQEFHPSQKIPEMLLNIDSSGKTLLHYAAAGNLNLNEGYFQQLIPRLGGRADRNGITALMMAAVYGSQRVITQLKLTEAGLQDVNGCTALMIAAKYGRLNVVEELIPLEATAMDNRGFIFVDYLSDQTPQRYFDRIHVLMRQHFRDYALASPEKLEKKEAPPDFTKLCLELENELDTEERQITEDILAAEKKLNVVADNPLQIILQDVDEAQKKMFALGRQEHDQVMGKLLSRLQSMHDISRQTAQQLEDEIDQSVGRLDERWKFQKQQTLVQMKQTIDKMHLQIIYEQNDLHEKFEKRFSALSFKLGKQRQLAIQRFTAYQKATEGNTAYTLERVGVQAMAKRYSEKNQVTVPKLKDMYQKAMEKTHQLCDQQVSERYDRGVVVEIEKIAANTHEIRQQIEHKTVQKIKPELMAAFVRAVRAKLHMSEYLGMHRFKQTMNALMFSFKQQRYNEQSYQFFAGLCELAHQYVESEEGLFQFCYNNDILPLRGCFPQYRAVDDYFKLHAGADSFSQEDLRNALKRSLAEQLNEQLEEKLVDHCYKFYEGMKPRQVPEYTLKKVGALIRQSINPKENETQYRGTRAYFYMSILGILIEVEQVQYEHYISITGLRLKTEPEYIGTTNQNFEPRAQYTCLSPGWCCLDQGEVVVVAEPFWEMQ